jgi:predicted transcriptional regulator
VTRKPDTRKGDRHSTRRSAIVLRLPDDVLARLDALAARLGRDRHGLVVTAVREYLHREEKSSGR